MQLTMVTLPPFVSDRWMLLTEATLLVQCRMSTSTSGSAYDSLKNHQEVHPLKTDSRT